MLDGSDKASDDTDFLIESIKKDLTPPEYSDFDEFDQHQKENAHFIRCCKSKEEVSLFFHCDDCCLPLDGVYCIYCFNETDHTNHHISVSFGSCAFCDCGDPKTIKKECWCPHHGKKIGSEELPENDYNLLLKSKIKEVFSSLTTLSQCKVFSKYLQFLYNLTDWGSSYINLISSILFEGNWNDSFYGQMIRNYSFYTSHNIRDLSNFLFKIVVSPDFKRGYTKFLNETFKILLKVYLDELFPKKFLKIADFSFQCFHECDLLIYFQESDSFFTNFVKLFTSIYNLPQFKNKGKNIVSIELNEDLHSTFALVTRIILDNVMMFKHLIDDIEFLEAFFHLISINSKNAIIRRKIGTKVQVNTNIHLYQLNNYMNMRFIWSIFANHLPMITCNFNNKDINYYEVFEYPIENITDEHIRTLNAIFSTFSEELAPFLNEINESSNSFNSISYYIQPYADEFVIDHPLAKLCVSSASCFALYNSINPIIIFERIGFEMFDQLAAIFAGSEAGKYQIIHGLFPMNDDSLVIMGHCYDDLCLSSLSEIQAIISMKEEFASRVVMIIAESFGIGLWESASENDSVDCQRWTNVITSMLRLFINLSCNDNFFNFHLDHEKMKKIVVDYVYSGQNNRIKIIDRVKSFTFETYIVDKAIEEVVDIRVDDKGSHFTLKPEYDDTSSVFSPNFNSKEFNKMLAFEIANHKGRLLRLCPINPPLDTFPFLKSYLQTNEMKTLIVRILNVMSNCFDKFSVSCAHTIFALIRLILIESESPEKIEEEFIEMEIITKLIKVVKKLENGILYLQNFSIECKQRYTKISDIIEKEIEGEVKKKTELTKKIDKSKILQKFASAQNEFALKNKEELSTVENTSPSSFNCVFCGEQFNSSCAYGIMAHMFRSSLLNNIESTIDYPILCQIRTCGHWSHCNCYHEEYPENSNFLKNERGIQCPLDRTYSNAIIPVFEGNEPDDSTKLEIKKLAEKILSICRSSAQECLAYNFALIEILDRHNPKCVEDKRTILCLIHFLRACFFIDVDAISNDPFVMFTIDFCSGGNIKDAVKKFNSKLPEFWHKLISIAASNDSSKDKKLLLIQTYVRRVSLLEHVAFFSDSDSIILPTINEFIESHHLKSIDDEMKSITPYHFISFRMSPCQQYSFPNLKENFTEYILNSDIILKNKNPKIIFTQCLLCGKMCYMNPIMHQNIDSSIEFFPHHVSKCSNGLSSLALEITGVHASRVFFYDGALRKFYDCGSIYTDKYGDQNIGLKHGNILFLNKTKVSRLFEDLVTGELRRKLELEVMQ